MDFLDKVSLNGTHFVFGADSENYIRAVVCDGESLRHYAKDCCFNDYRILLLLEGEGSYADDEGRVFTLEPGSFLQRLPGCNHHITRSRDKKWLEFALVISEELHRKVADLGMFDISELHCRLNNLSLCCHQIVEYMSFLRKMCDRDDGPMAVVETMNFFLKLQRGQKEQDELFTKIEQARQILNSCINRVPLMSEVATEIGMGYHSFRKCFKQETGVSPKEYFVRLRINRAVEMLSVGSNSLTEIAYELGYPDFMSFAKQFKKRIGVSPGKFRDQK